MTRMTIEPPGSSRMLDNSFSRFSPHSPKGVYPDAIEGGFVPDSYLKGLRPRGFWLHAQAAREGLCDTAVKTRDTGSEQRLAMKSCEDVSVRYDHTVRGCTNEIISFRFGDTGFDPKKLERKNLEVVGVRGETLRDNLYYRIDDECFYKMSDDEKRLMLYERRTIDRCIERARRALCEANESTRIITPGNLEATIIEMMDFFGHPVCSVLWSEERSNIRWYYSPTSDTSYAAKYSSAQLALPIFNRYSTYQKFVEWQTKNFDHLERCTESEVVQLVNRAVRKWRRAGICDPITECEVRLRLASKQVTRRFEMSQRCLEGILAVYERVLYDAMAPAGEAVGALMVTSIGQPSTQMTLNTFHLSGKSNVGVISGLPRMQEISHVTVTAKMKGLKVIVMFHDNSFLLLMGQRQVIQRLLTKMLLSGPRQLSMAVRAQQIEKQLITPRRQQAENAIVSAAQNIVLTVTRQSRFSEKRNIENHDVSRRVMARDLLKAILALTGDKKTVSLVQCMLSDFTSDWRTEPFGAIGFQVAAPSIVKAHKALTALVRKSFIVERKTTPLLLCESVWRSVLPFVGGEASHIVHAYRETDKNFRLAIVVLGCNDGAETQLYDIMRLNRASIFVDLLGDNDGVATPMFQQICIEKNPPKEVKMSGEQFRESNASLLRNAIARGLLKNMIATHVVDIAESFAIIWQPLVYNAETKKISVQFAPLPQPAPVTEFDDEATKLLARYTSVLEKLQAFAAQHGEQLTSFDQETLAQLKELENERTACEQLGEILEKRVDKQRRENVRIATQQAKDQLFADDSERAMCDLYYGSGRFADRIYCTREECVAARLDARETRHTEACCGCQSSFVAVFRLDRRWFENNKMQPELLGRSLSRELGKHFHVLIGDANCDDYIPLHVRVRTCSLEDSVEHLKLKRFKDVANFGLFSTNNNNDDDYDDGDDEHASVPTQQSNAAQSTTANAEQEDDIDEFITDRSATSTPQRLSNTAIQAARVNYRKPLVASDGPLAILDHIIYIILNHSMCGPSKGTAVMFDEEARQIYTEEKGFETSARFGIACNSSDYNFILGLRGVDTMASRTNSVHDVTDVYGIEAGREAIIREYAEVLRDGSYVNRSHLAVRADIQTRHGYLAPLTADGLRAANHDVIQSSSHRENAHTVVDAALRSRATYPLVSPSACIAIGSPIANIGTGIVTLIQRWPKENEFIYVPDEPRDILIQNKKMLLSIINRIRNEHETDIDISQFKAWSTDLVPKDPDKFNRDKAARAKKERDQLLAQESATTTLMPWQQQPVVNGIALDQVAPDIAAKIQDDLNTQQYQTATVENPQYPHGFHPALLDGNFDSPSRNNNDDDDDDGSEMVNAKFSPAQEVENPPAPISSEEAMAVISNDLRNMSSPQDELRLQSAQQAAFASLSKLKMSTLPDDVAKLFDDDDDDEHTRVKSPEYTKNEDADDKKSISSDSSDTSSDNVSSSSSDDTNSDGTSTSSTSDTKLRGPQVVERDVSDDKQQQRFIAPHSRNSTAETLRLAEARRASPRNDDPDDDQDRVLAQEVAHLTIPLGRSPQQQQQENAVRRNAPIIPPMSQPRNYQKAREAYQKRQLELQQQQQQRLAAMAIEQQRQQEQRQRKQQQYATPRQRNKPVWPQPRVQPRQTEKITHPVVSNTKHNNDNDDDDIGYSPTRPWFSAKTRPIDGYNPEKPWLTEQTVSGSAQQKTPAEMIEKSATTKIAEALSNAASTVLPTQQASSTSTKQNPIEFDADHFAIYDSDDEKALFDTDFLGMRRATDIFTN